MNCLIHLFDSQGLQGSVGMRQHFMSVMRGRRSFEAKYKSTSVELKVAQEDLGSQRINALRLLAELRGWRLVMLGSRLRLH